MQEVIVAEDVSKSYGDVTALEGVSLRVDAGEVFGLIGPNGAGKTTLVRALTGTTNVSGTVGVLGASPRAVDPGRIGLLPQSFTPATRLTPRELVGYYAGLYDDARDVDAVLADVGLVDDADRRYEALSGGQRRRLCVGTALVNDPDVLFLDEPTTGIDPAGRRAMWGLVEGLAAAGTTVLLTSHSMDEVERLSDRVGLLADGRLVAVGSPAGLIADHGGDPRLVVGLADPDGGDADVTPPPDARRTLAGAGYAVEAVDGDGDADLVVRDADPAAIGGVVDALDDAGVAYDSLVWRQPGLEDVYLRLTGESFAPAGGPGAGRGSPPGEGRVAGDGEPGATARANAASDDGDPVDAVAGDGQ